jgi:hypothetical protein
MHRRACLLVALCVLAAGCGSTTDIAPDAGADVARAELTAAGLNLTTWYQRRGTYAGGRTGLPSVTVARADATSWCVENSTDHLAGPGGTVAAGPCP